MIGTEKKGNLREAAGTEALRAVACCRVLKLECFGHVQKMCRYGA